MTRHKKHVVRGVVIACVVLSGVFALCLADTLLVGVLWKWGYPSAAYYFNYTNKQVAFEEGEYYFLTRAYDLDRAAKAYQLVLSLDPQTPLVHYQLARIYLVQGDFARATHEINTELAINPYHLRSLYVRGLIEMSQANFAAAEKDFRDFVAWAPTEWGGYNDLAYVLAKEVKYKESEAVIREAMQKVPNAKEVPWLWNSLGLAQLNQFHYGEARDSFKKALDLANTMTLGEWRRAYSANDPAGDMQSIEAFQKAIAANLETAQAGAE